MQAEIITIGDEILIGQTIDSNSAWIAGELNKAGIRVSRINSIADEASAINAGLDESLARVDLVLMTGGLGPTADDITKKTLADYFGMPLVMNEEVLADIRGFFDRIGKPMLEMNEQQAMLPAGAHIVRNRKGTASGMWFEKEGKVLISMPGVPYEMVHLMESGFMDMIESRFRRGHVFHRTVMTFGQGESFIADTVKDWEAGLASTGVKLAYLPSPGIVKMRLSAFGDDSEELERKVMDQAIALERLIPDIVYGYDDETLEAVVAGLLKEKGKTISAAESCTGGYISHLLTSIPGSSDYLEGGLCTYSYASKTELLGVDSEIIIEKGAVSEEVVIAMAEGCRKLYQTDIAIAVSGIAGPSGGTPDKPVGTVWMAVAHEDGMFTHCFHFGRDRMRNIRMTALHALNEVRRILLARG
jgi:nicotinamide-nucleotide amidase